MRILVETYEGKPVEGVTPAIARKLRRAGLAAAKHDPFRLVLIAGLDEVPKEDKMVQRTRRRMPGRGFGRQDDAARARQDITAFCRMAEAEGEDRPEVWVRNLAAAKISLEIDVKGGDPVYLDPLPISPHPYLLTEDVDLEVLQQSVNFKKMLKSVDRKTKKPRIELVTTAEAEEHYTQYAQADEHWSEASIRIHNARNKAGQAQEEHFTELAQFAPPRTAQDLFGVQLARQGIDNSSGAFRTALDPKAAQALLAEEEDLRRRMGIANPNELHLENDVNARVMQLCHEAGPSVDESARLPASEFMANLASQAHTLGEVDLEYIQSNGVYQQVKKWAADLKAKRFYAELTTDEEMPVLDTTQAPETIQGSPSPLSGFANTPIPSS